MEVLRAFFGLSEDARYTIIIRLPHALAATLTGAGLASAGAAMQSILRNPLGLPFTLGISQAGAFGAAFAVMLLGTGTMQSTQVGAVTILNPYMTAASALVGGFTHCFWRRLGQMHHARRIHPWPPS